MSEKNPYFAKHLFAKQELIGHLHQEVLWPILPLNKLVGILLMPKIDETHKNYLTPEIWNEKHLREIFYGTLILQQRSMICIGRHVGGHTLPSNMAAKTSFCLHLVKLLIVVLRCAANITLSFCQHFLWSLSAKFVFRKQ